MTAYEHTTPGSRKGEELANYPDALLRVPHQTSLFASYLPRRHCPPPPPPPPPGLTSHIHVYGVIRQLHKLVRTLDDVLAW
jgi:hypothetical protein